MLWMCSCHSFKQNSCNLTNIIQDINSVCASVSEGTESPLSRHLWVWYALPKIHAWKFTAEGSEMHLLLQPLHYIWFSPPSWRASSPKTKTWNLVCGVIENALGTWIGIPFSKLIFSSSNLAQMKLYGSHQWPSGSLIQGNLATFHVTFRAATISLLIDSSWSDFVHLTKWWFGYVVLACGKLQKQSNHTEWLKCLLVLNTNQQNDTADTVIQMKPSFKCTEIGMLRTTGN